MTAESRRLSILVVDDDAQLRSMICELLRSEGMLAEQAENGRKALSQFSTRDYDLVVLDIMMPVMDGLQVLDQIRTSSSVPVLMLTARGDDEDRIAGLEHGADDYLAKPFNPRELLLRVKAILKRGRGSSEATDDVLEVGPLVFETLKHQATLGGERLKLTGAELRILEALMRSPGKVISREHLTKFALGRALTAYDRSLDTHVSHLRSKLGKDETGQSPIRSMRGAGYVLVADDWEPQVS